jgi:hypothetical protein
MNLPKNKRLIIFDFDETLCKTNGLIGRTNHDTGTIDLLTPGEYSKWRASGEYCLNPQTWDLDFKSFTGYPNEGEIIKPTMQILGQTLLCQDSVVALVTGRDELAGPKQWLETCMISTDQMILMCSGDPNKRMCYESLINTLSPSSVAIYEDGASYIKQCYEVCTKYNVPMVAHLIKDGQLKKNWRIK